MAPRVAIVGAGWSGLAAAVDLVDAGVAVTVFEAARQPGGRARSLRLDDDLVDNGQHLLSGAYREALALLERLGVNVDRALLRLPLEILVPGSFHLRLRRLPAPWHLAAGLFAAGGPSFGDKLHAARLVRRLQATDCRLAGDQTVATWLDANGQRGVLRRHLWESLCLAALNTPPEHASAQVFANVLRDTLGGRREATDLLIPLVDLGRLLPQPASEFIRARGGSVRHSARVRSIAAGERGFTVSGDGFAETFAQVILACAPQHAAALLPAVPELTAIATTIADLRYEPICTVYARYSASLRLPLPLLALDRAPGQWVFDRGALGGPPGLLAHVLSASGAWQELSNTALAAALHGSLAAALPGLPAPISQRVIREQRATFACTPNLARPANATPLAGLWLAGDYTAGDYPATLEAAVRSGRAAARGVLGEVQPVASAS